MPFELVALYCFAYFTINYHCSKSVALFRALSFYLFVELWGYRIISTPSFLLRPFALFYALLPFRPQLD